MPRPCCGCVFLHRTRADCYFTLKRVVISSPFYLSFEKRYSDSHTHTDQCTFSTLIALNRLFVPLCEERHRAAPRFALILNWMCRGAANLEICLITHLCYLSCASRRRWRKKSFGPFAAVAYFAAYVVYDCVYLYAWVDSMRCGLLFNTITDPVEEESVSRLSESNKTKDEKNAISAWKRICVGAMHCSSQCWCRRHRRRQSELRSTMYLFVLWFVCTTNQLANRIFLRLPRHWHEKYSWIMWNIRIQTDNWMISGFFSVAISLNHYRHQVRPMWTPATLLIASISPPSIAPMSTDCTIHIQQRARTASKCQSKNV